MYIDYAIINLTKDNHTSVDDKSLILKTIFGDMTVSVSDIIFTAGAKGVYVPCYLFALNGFNPCQMINGYVQTICHEVETEYQKNYYIGNEEYVITFNRASRTFYIVYSNGHMAFYSKQYNDCLKMLDKWRTEYLESMF